MKRKGLPITQEQMVASIEAWLAKASPEENLSGRRWYWCAKQVCDKLALEYAYEPNVGYGVVAALSPGAKWEQNLRDAANLFQHKRRARVTTYGANKRKALAILRGASPGDVLGGSKVTAFYDCIASPSYSNRVCLDRHATRAALGCTLREANLYVRRKGNYDTIAQAYCIVAARNGLQPHQVQAIVWLVFRASETKYLAEVPF